MAKDVVVIGAGVIGCSTAYYLVQRGHRVTIVDRGTPEHENCSFGNAGYICPSHFVPLAAPGMVKLGLKWMWNPESPFYIKPRLSPELFDWGIKFWRAANAQHVVRSAPLLRDLGLASRACFEEMAQEFDFGLMKRGCLMLCKTEERLEEEAHIAKEAHALGLKAEVLGPKQTSALDPSIQMDIAGAVYFPQDCHLTPRLFMTGLRQHLEKAGVKFLWQTDVSSFAGRASSRGITSIQTTRDTLSADEYVLAAGSWSPGLARTLALPMQAGKGYSLTLTKPRELPQIPAIFLEARVAVTPMGTSLRFGGTMEIAGLNEQVNPARIRGIVNSVSNYYPNFRPEDFREVKPWCGLRPVTPDGLPYVGRTRQYENLTIATGHAMLGLSLGPITGKLVAEILSNERPSIDLALCNPDRYSR
jgi:D-amino-acid dehydrogenase